MLLGCSTGCTLPVSQCSSNASSHAALYSTRHDGRMHEADDALVTGVCNRRQWPEPFYEPYDTPQGHFCKVRVNNREYSTDVPYSSEELARDGAAMKAFMICRQFSHNDGMCPGQRPGQAMSGHGPVQGLPVAIGVGRRSARNSDASSDGSDGGSSGGNSPKSVESGFEQQMQMRRMSQPVPKPQPRRHHHHHHHNHAPRQFVCPCGQGVAWANGRCEWCNRGRNLRM